MVSKEVGQAWCYMATRSCAASSKVAPSVELKLEPAGSVIRAKVDRQAQVRIRLDPDYIITCHLTMNATKIAKESPLKKFAYATTVSCSVHASAYGKCIAAKYTDARKDMCKEEFYKFVECLRATVSYDSTHKHHTAYHTQKLKRKW